MAQKQKSSVTTQTQSPYLSLIEAVDVLGVRGVYRYSALKLFKKEEPKTEKDWRVLFTKKRITHN